MHSHLDTCITPKTQGFRTSKGSMYFIKTRCIHSKCNRWQSAASSGDSSCNNPAMFVAHFPHTPSQLSGTFPCPFPSWHTAQRIQTFLSYQKDCWCFPHGELHPSMKNPQKEIAQYRQKMRSHPWMKLCLTDVFFLDYIAMSADAL